MPTRFEVSGVVLSQVVEHVGGGWRYGITADPSPQNWGGCGISSDPHKVVDKYRYNNINFYSFRCGGPKYDSKPSWGYRHILWKHRTDFENLAAGTYQNWRQIADLSTSAAISDPDKKVDRTDGKICYSRVIYLRNIRTNQTVRTQIVRVVVGKSSKNVISAYPAKTHC